MGENTKRRGPTLLPRGRRGALSPWMSVGESRKLGGGWDSVVNQERPVRSQVRCRNFLPGVYS